MKTIHKYDLEIVDDQRIRMPYGAKILCVQVQHGQPRLWAEVDTDNEPVSHRITMHGTGHDVGTFSNKEYIGTVQTSGGLLVWHVYLNHCP